MCQIKTNNAKRKSNESTQTVAEKVSLTFRRNRVGARTDPWGIPILIK